MSKFWRSLTLRPAPRPVSRASRLVAVVAFLGAVVAADACAAQAPTPELFHYTFDESGAVVTNRASSPPPGTGAAALVGGLTQGGAITGTYLSAVVGTGGSSDTDYVNTGWATSLADSWTISFFSDDIDTPSLTYVMGDVTAGEIRIFTNGVAGSGNWLLRGTTITDTVLIGGAVQATTMNTFVYDAPANEVRAYLNGVLVNTVAQGGPVTAFGVGPFKVAGYGASAGLNAGGKVGDVRIYSRALSPAEITDIYDAAFVPPPTPPTVPTLGETALMLLALMLGAFGLILAQARISLRARV